MEFDASLRVIGLPSNLATRCSSAEEPFRQYAPMTRMSMPSDSAQSSVAAVIWLPVSSTTLCGYRCNDSCRQMEAESAVSLSVEHNAWRMTWRTSTGAEKTPA